MDAMEAKTYSQFKSSAEFRLLDGIRDFDEYFLKNIQVSCNIFIDSNQNIT